MAARICGGPRVAGSQEGEGREICVSVKITDSIANISGDRHIRIIIRWQDSPTISL